MGPVIELTEIKMNPNEHSRVVKIDKGLKKELVQQLIELLFLNQDVFPWTYTDIVGHQSNINPQAKPVCQKPRALDANSYKVLQNTIDHLLKIANPILVIKTNEKWRMWIDFMSLNKTFPKDSSTLPQIDQLVGATAGHELLSIMDVYSGYNQI